MNTPRVLCLAAACCIIGQSPAWTGELVYHPINPAFGGNPYNYSWLRESANAQNEHKEKKDHLEDFEDSLKKRILSTLASRIVDTAFGRYGDDLQGGQYQFGDYDITISTEGGGVNVNIIDNGNGSSTTVSVPYY